MRLACAIGPERRFTQPPEVQAFVMWFLGTRFPRSGLDEADATRADQILERVEENYPGLRSAAPAEQKLVGKKMVQMVREMLG